MYPMQKQVRTKPYSIWLAMKTRCYVVTAGNYKNYGAKGVTVCDEWMHDFQSFASWYVAQCEELGINPENHSHQLDKDILCNQLGITPAVYSPTTCKLVTPKVNSKHSSSKVGSCKTHRFLDPNGDEVDVTNLRVFCEDNQLSYNSMRSVTCGRSKAHKGYTLRDI